jgi:hypothetical protein
MKKTLTVLLVMGFMAASFTGITFAQEPGMNYGGRNYNSQAKVEGVNYNLVELTDSQIEKIIEIRNEFFNETEKLRDQFEDLNHEIRNLKFRRASHVEIGEVEDQLEKVLNEMNEKRSENQENIKSILTDSQLEKIEENSFDGKVRDKSNGRRDKNKRSNNRK